MKITISNIPGDFPTGYSEQYYIDTRSVRIGKESTIIETEKSHKALNDQIFKKRKIQSIFYDKYTIEFVTTESIDIDRVNMANFIQIVQDSGEIHEAEIIDFSDATRMQNSEFRLYNLVYINLSNKKTIDYLSSDTVGSSNKSYFEYYNYYDAETINLNSLLNVNLDISPYEFTENDDNGLKMRSSEYTFKVAEFTGYLSESEKNDLLFYSNYFNLSTLKIYENQDSLVSYSAIEVPQITVEDSDLEGLYPVTIRVRYEQEYRYPLVPVPTIVPDDTSYHFVAGASGKNIPITYTGEGDWFVESYPAWAPTTYATTHVEILVPDPFGGANSGTIVLRSNFDASVSATITLTQDAP